MDRISTTAVIVALAAGAMLVAGCEQRGQDTARQGEQASSKLASKSDQPGLMGKQDQSAPPSAAAQPGQAPQPAQSSGPPGSKMAGAVDDSAITAKVKASLLAEPGLKSTQIDVETKDATVTLSGTVPSETMKDRAKQIAMSTDGVRNVVDHIEVRAAS